MRPPLKPWQPAGVDFLCDPHRRTRGILYLADDMGLGKTAIVVSAARKLKLRRMLIACPKTARELVWLHEWERFWPEDAHNIRKVVKLKDEIPEEGHVVCTFDFMRRRYTDLFIHGRWDCFVIDEFHGLRGTRAARTRAALHYEEGLVARSDRLWALTGTPLASHAGELYPIMKLAGVYKGTLDEFVRRYCETYYDPTRGELRVVGVNEDNLPELHAVLDGSGLMLRRLKRDVMPELPELVYERVDVKKGEVDLEQLFPEWAMSDRMAELVEEVERERELASDEMDAVEEGEVLGTMTFAEGLDRVASLAESVSTLLLIVGMQKVAAVAQLIREELEAGLYPKVFLITRHVPVGEALTHALRDFGAVRLYGGSTDKQRLAAVDRFTNDDGCRVFVGQVLACGPAVNLTARGKCWEVGLVEQSPVPGENDQAVTRPHRIGCERQVRVRLFKLDDPVDARWEELVHSKSSHIATVMREGRLLEKEFDPIG